MSLFILGDPARAYFSTASVSQVASNSYRKLSEAYGGPPTGDAALRFGLRQAERLGFTLMMIPESALIPAPAADLPAAPPLQMAINTEAA